MAKIILKDGGVIADFICKCVHIINVKIWGVVYRYTKKGLVISHRKKFNNIKVDLTKENKEITDKYKILGLPVVAFIDKNGKEIEQLRVTGFLKPEEFSKLMEKALNN